MRAIDDARGTLLSAGPSRAAPGLRAGKRVSIALIDRQPLTRRCLTHWLQEGTPDSHIVSVGSPADLLNGSGSPVEPHIIIFSIGAATVGDPDVFGKIILLRRHLGFIPLILLSDRDDVDNIVAAIEYGVRCYVPTSLEPSEAAAALQCVMAGGTFVPVSAIIKFAKDRTRSPRADEPENNSFQQLSKRENEVLTRLRRLLRRRCRAAAGGGDHRDPARASVGGDTKRWVPLRGSLDATRFPLRSSSASGPDR